MYNSTRNMLLIYCNALEPERPPYFSRELPSTTPGHFYFDGQLDFQGKMKIFTDVSLSFIRKFSNSEKNLDSFCSGILGWDNHSLYTGCFGQFLSNMKCGPFFVNILAICGQFQKQLCGKYLHGPSFNIIELYPCKSKTMQMIVPWNC